MQPSGPFRTKFLSSVARRACVALCLGSGVFPSTAALAASTTTNIYTCVDAQGHKRTSDRPIVECMDREQRMLNPDGSERHRVGPSLSAEDRQRQDEAIRKKLAEESAKRDNARLDRNFLARFPDKATHDRARVAALEPLTKAKSAGDLRMKELTAERKRLDAETEFYKGQKLPAKLKAQYEQNQAATDGQRQVIKDHDNEMRRINALYDEELARLRKLWAGAAPGSLGPAGPLPDR